MVTRPAASETEWLEKARSFAPLINEYRDEAEQKRHLPEPLFQRLKDEGFFRLALPAAYGGTQASLVTLARVVEELSRHDGSVGWNVLITGAGGFFADYLPDDGAQEVFGDGNAVVASTFAPAGQAVETGDSFKGSGRWSFASGCHNANWFIAGFLIMEDGTPRLNESGKPDVRLMLMPKSECQIVDTWRTTGMRGTGSHDYVVSECFIPNSRSFPFSQFDTGPSKSDAAYPYPFSAIAPQVLAVVALGVARDAIESLKALAMTKTPRGGVSRLAQQHTVHERIGTAEALVRAARAYLYETLRQTESVRATTPDQLTDLLANGRLAGCYAARCAAEAVDLMFDAGGGSSIYTDSRLDRCFRDVHTITHHWMVSSSGIEMVGQYLLGLGLQVRR